MYLSLLFANILITYLATNFHVGIYIAFGFVAFMSSLYYDKKLNIFTVILSYLSMALAVYIRSFDQYQIDTECMNKSNLSWFIPHFAGYTIEFIFVYLISSSLTGRSFRTLKKLFETQNEQKRLVDEMNITNEKINRIAKKLQKQNLNLHTTQMDIIKFVAKILGSHDLFTGFHVIHTQKYVDIICRQLKALGYYQKELTDENINLFKTAAFLHDTGKIHIPERVLNKMGKFTDSEFKLMQCHPEEGAKLLESLPQIEDGKFNKIAHDMALYHHEKWDGSGYPMKIKGEEIPLCARIMAAADVLDALISTRLYKKPFTIDKAMQIFEESKGTHFEPCIAEAVIASKPLIFVIDQEFKMEESAEMEEELSWWQKYHEEAGDKPLTVE